MSPGRPTLLAMLSLGLALGCSKAEHALHGAARGEDVVVVVIDTLRADALPMYGSKVDTAPTLARLASEGALFEHAWASSSWTAPSTASLFTAQHPDQHGVISGYHAYKSAHQDDKGALLNQIPPLLETLPLFFQRQGYQTFGIADNPNITGRLGFARGFDDFLNTSEAAESYAGAEAVNHAVRAWKDKRRDASKPAFVYVHYMDPHAPYNAREPWYRAPAEEGEIAADRAAYDSEIRYLDVHLAELLEILEVGPRTLLVITSDHGEEFGDHGGRYHDFKLYSELTHIPLILRAPDLGIAPRRIVGEVGLVDILPTLRALAGAPPGGQDAGVSLLPMLGGERDPGRATFAMRTREGAESQSKHAVMRDGWKYILSRPEGTEELYDLERDPRERSNRVAEEPERARELRRLVEDLEKLPRVQRSFSAPAQMSPEQLDRLKRLGYTY